MYISFIMPTNTNNFHHTILKTIQSNPNFSLLFIKKKEKKEVQIAHKLNQEKYESLNKYAKTESLTKVSPELGEYLARFDFSISN